MNTKKGAWLACPKYLIAFLFMLFCNKLFATNYYVNPSSSSSISNGSLLNPWKTIAQVNSGTTNLNPGDTVFFKRDQIYSGRLNITRSGNSTSPIVYTNYGEGNLPEFDNAISDIININGRQYVIIDGIKIIDNTMSPTDHGIQAKISYAINLNNSPNCTIRNCDISLVGVGIAATTGSNNTTITGNYFHNLRMVRNTPTAINANDDYGANPMVIGTSNNTISNNRFEECWGISYDYGYDGGSVEFFGTTMNNNKILYNTAINCNGFIEIGSSSNGIAQDNIIAYNKIINCGIIGAYQNGSRYTTTIKNIQYYNNTIVETMLQYSKSSTMFWMAGTGSQGMVVLKNNIFWLSSGVNLASSKFNTGQMIHMYNVYRMDRGILAITLDNSERLSTTELHFTNTNGDPDIWDYNLLPSSTAIDFGTDLGYSRDFSGNSIVGNPDAGILEFNSTMQDKPLSVKVTAIPLNCISETTSATAVASGGKPPYSYAWNTSPIQTTATAIALSAGEYSVLITDSTGTSVSTAVTIALPEKPSAPTLDITEPNCFETTGKITVTSPTGNGIQHSKDGVSYQQSGIFSNLLPGNYNITAKNLLECISNPTMAIIQIPTAQCISGIFNSNTTCLGYQSGGSGSALNRACYTTRMNKIATVSPSQFIYYAIITAPLVNFCVDIVQSKTIAGFRFFGILQKSQIFLWSNSCTRISIGTEVSSGQGRICINNAVPGTKYILSIKYETKNITGNSFTGSAPECNYFFESSINGTAIPGSKAVLNLSPNCLPSLLETEMTMDLSPSLLMEENNEIPFNAMLSSNTSKGNFTLSITGKKNELATVRIIDMNGRNMQTMKMPSFQTIEFGDTLKEGIYTVEVTQGQNRITLKAIKVFGGKSR